MQTDTIISPIKDFPLDVNFPLCLAPMVGLSHIVLRQVVQSYMPEEATTIWPSEMLNSRRIPHENLDKVAEAMWRDEPNYWIPQILGNEEVPIKISIKKLEDYGAAGVDMNMGCPVKKALKHNYGVALMGDESYAAEVVDMAVQASSGPVSVKLRTGLEKDLPRLLSFISALKNAGASWITLHPRTAEQKRRGVADWDQVRLVRDELKIPVIGNGDIQTAEDVVARLEQTNCQMVMAGRALTARPWMVWQLGEKLGFPNPAGMSGSAPQTPEEEAQEYGKCCVKILDGMFEHFRPRLAYTKFVFYIKTSCVWLNFGHSLYGLTTKHKEYEPLREALLNFFDSSTLRMSLKTELRE